MRRFIILLCCVLFAAGIQAQERGPVPHIPILGWYSIPAGEFATLEHYREMRDAGFDYSFSHTYSYADAVKALALCAAVGMKSIFMCPELETAPEETARKVMHHPGLGGYFLRDEPGNDAMEALGTWARRIESVDSAHPCYLNLLPSYVFTLDGYEQHLRHFTQKVRLPQISFDCYPIKEDSDRCVVNPRWYENLEQVSANAKRSGKPFWAFALATAHTPYPIPTLAHLRLQIYCNLAYGAQLLQYFTYWNPGTETWNFHQAPITQEGRRSPVYELVREMNAEIQQRAFVWAGCTVERVSHIAEDIPAGTHRLTQLPPHFLSIQHTQGSGLVSELENAGRHFVMFVNTSPNDEWHVRIETDEHVQLLRRDGTRVPARRYDPLFILSPGNCEIFEIEK